MVLSFLRENFEKQVLNRLLQAVQKVYLQKKFRRVLHNNFQDVFTSVNQNSNSKNTPGLITRS